MFEQVVLGIVQGIAEWLPVSTEGLLIIIKENFFPGGMSFNEMIAAILFLHLGTFFAALIYLRKEVLRVFRTFLNWKKSTESDQNLFLFLIFSTLISGFFGLILLKLFGEIFERASIAGTSLTLFVGILLLFTGALQLISISKKIHLRKMEELSPKDSLVLGLAQGFAALPGLSRSGLTVSAFLLSRFDKEDAIRLSFLMSLPIVLAGNIAFNLTRIGNISGVEIIGFFFAFIFGLLTLDLLIRLARKINFGWFVIFFGIITILASFVV